VEFVNQVEVVDLLDEYGVEEIADGPDRVHLKMRDGDGVVHMHLACPESGAKPRNGARVKPVTKDQLPCVLESMIHRLHLNQVVLIPVGRWRKVFDAVAFSMAQNASKQVRDDWVEFDAAATVELNTRDPLLCDPGDFHTLMALIKSLLSDADSPEQGLLLVATASPVLVELVPDGAVRVSLGSQVLADELAEAFAG
jgi:hypothetical protein